MLHHSHPLRCGAIVAVAIVALCASFSVADTAPLYLAVRDGGFLVPLANEILVNDGTSAERYIAGTTWAP